MSFSGDTSVSLCFLICKMGLTAKAILIGSCEGRMRQCLWPRGEVCRGAAVLLWLLLMSGEDVFRSLSRVVPPARAPCLVGFPLGSAQDGQWPAELELKVMRASVHSQRLLFQLDVFSEHLWPEAVREGQTPPCWGLSSSRWGLPAPPSGWTLGSLTRGSSSGVPAALVLLATQENCEVAVGWLNAGTWSFWVKKLV